MAIQRAIIGRNGAATAVAGARVRDNRLPLAILPRANGLLLLSRP